MKRQAETLLVDTRITVTTRMRNDPEFVVLLEQEIDDLRRLGEWSAAEQLERLAFSKRLQSSDQPTDHT